MANIDNVQLPDGSSYNIVDNTSGFATQNYVDSAVSSVTKTTIGLGNVDNTSDLNKPISTATQAALNTLDEDKADKTDIATVESGTTASRAYSVGELVYVSGTLYRVKTAIASGTTFTVGTNIEVTNVSNAIGNKGSVSVTTDSIKTNAQIFAELYALIDHSKMSMKSKLVHTVSNAEIVHFIAYCDTVNGAYRFGNVSANGTIITTTAAIITSNLKHYSAFDVNISTNAVEAGNLSNVARPSGEKYIIYY